MDAKLLEIAKEYFPAVEERGNLETRDCDSEDFFEVSVWGLKGALEAAYRLGMKEGMKQ